MWFEIVVGQFELGVGKCVFEVVWICDEFFIDGVVGWVYFYGYVGVGYYWYVVYRWISCIDWYVFFFDVDWLLLVGFCWVFGQFLFVIE